MSADDPRVGTWLKDKWHLDALLGVGGVGSVYAATHRNRSRAALKILRPDLAVGADLVTRFLREGMAANAVGHPDVVQVLDDDVTDDGLVFLVMELLEGETWEQRARRLGGRIPGEEAAAVADRVLAVLEAAHARHVVHRDLKPDNVFLTRDGGLKVLDFGLARLREGLLPGAASTQHGYLMGTPGFMPPEQVRGHWDRVDARSDVWAVGASLHAVLTGRRVHEVPGQPVDVFATATMPVPPIGEIAPGLPRALCTVIDRALSLHPADRWPSAAAMRAALSDAVPGLPPSSGSIHGPTSSSRPPRSGPPSSSQRRVPTPRTISSAPQIEGLPPDPHSLRLPDNTAPVEIAPDTWWVGKRDPKSIFHSNPYLRVFKGGAGDYALLIDPGSSSDFAVVSAKVTAVLGRLGAISGLFINHQDPDVGSSAAPICGRYAPHASIFCSEATWRLIVHLNLPRDRFVDTDALGGGIALPTGHLVLPVPSPFCHFRGAVMLYDPETRVLFSGDLLGGITGPEVRDLWADEADWSGVRAFHQAYMPTNRALASAVKAIQRLDPPVEIIAPQHGRLLRGPLVQSFLQRLERLPVGVDVMDEIGEGDDAMTAWSSVLNRVLYTARMILGDEVDDLLDGAPELRDCCTRKDGRFEVVSAGRWTISTVVRLLTAGGDPALSNPIRLEAVHACEELELPSPDVLLDGEQSIAATMV
jgi:serine/threonine-protein kinase